MEQSLENMKNEILLLQNMIYILIQKGQKFGAVLMELFTYLLTYWSFPLRFPFIVGYYLKAIIKMPNILK